MYEEYTTYISKREKRKLQSAIKKKHKHAITIHLQHHGGDAATLLLTKTQKKKVERAKSKGKHLSITMSKKQLEKNMVFKGGFLSMLAGLAAKVLPTLLTGIASGALAGAVEKAVTGDGLYVQKGEHCYRADPVEGDGLYLSPRHSRISDGDGLYLQHGTNIYDGKGLILGTNSPFKNIPILGWIL